MQKVHNHGTDGARYFWNVSIQGGSAGEYRSRHSTAAAVRAEFARNGKKVTSIKPAQA